MPANKTEKQIRCNPWYKQIWDFATRQPKNEVAFHAFLFLGIIIISIIIELET